MEDKQKDLFVRIPLQNIKFEDSYEQLKFEKIKLDSPGKAINYFENVFKDMIVTISFN